MTLDALAELEVRHTRRHMPTRRVAIASTLLPAGGSAAALLLGCVAAMGAAGLDDDQLAEVPAFLAEARQGAIEVPRRRLRFRLQTDLVGLARSRHRLLGEHGGLVVELDVSSQYPVPQLIAAVWAASRLAPRPRAQCLESIERSVGAPGVFPSDVEIRYVTEFEPVTFVLDGNGAGGNGTNGSGGPGVGAGPDWSRVPGELRWAMEVLGYGPADSPTRVDVQRRYRRLLKVAHPDHGGAESDAAHRIDELAEARRVVLGDVDGSAPG